MRIVWAYDRGVWPCPEYRQMNSRVKLLTGAVEELLQVTKDINQKLENAEKQRKEDLGEVQGKNDALTGENTQLRQKTAKMSEQIADLTLRSYRQRDQPSTVAVGDNLLQDVSEDLLVDTTVRYRKDAQVADLAEDIRGLSRGYDNIAIITRANDCDRTDPPDAATIVQSYGQLIDHAKDKAKTVTVSSIPPRLTTKDTREKISAINAGLLTLCKEKGTTFVDNDQYFVFPDGTINEGFLTADGVHVASSGVNKIAKAIDRSRECSTS